MAVGSNLDYGNWAAKLRKIIDVLTTDDKRGQSGTTEGLGSMICSKVAATAPANNTAADNPRGIGDICLFQDTDDDTFDVYVCTAWTADASATTWTKISA